MNSIKLKDFELYFSDIIDPDEKIITISGSEAKHVSKVMRHKTGDKLFVTDGRGKIFTTEIVDSKKDLSVTKIISEKVFHNSSKNIFFCLPLLRNPERLEFAIEKSVELGITNFFIYRGKRSVNKNIKLERLNKIAVSAMKQSLRTFLPSILFSEDLYGVSNNEGEFFVLHQETEKKLKDVLINTKKNSYFIFGPEGGFDISELEFFSNNDYYQLSVNRLRSETAVVAVASFLNNS